MANANAANGQVPAPESLQCRYCAEEIPSAARFCRHCERFQRFRDRIWNDVSLSTFVTLIPLVTIAVGVTPLGGDVLVQSFLAAPVEAANVDRAEVWTITDGPRTISLDLPRRIFPFDPIVMNKDLISVYNSPDALMMCSEKRTPCSERSLTNDWTANWHEGNWANVTATDGPTGWIYLPNIGRLHNNISDFSSALVSYYRKDFSQSARLFERASILSRANATLRHDAAVLSLIARTRDGQSVRDDFAKLLNDDPYSLYVFQAWVMARLEEAVGLPASQRSEEFRMIASSISKNRALFHQGDTWLRQVDQFIGRN